MKKFLHTVLIGLFVSCMFFLGWNITQGASSRNFSNPISILDSVKWNANKKYTEQVQKTDLDNVTAKACEDLIETRFTLSRTLCNLKMLSKDYLQYVIYFGLAAATILLIRNGFKIVTSTDREKEMSAFKKNILYIIIGVVLLIWFYYIIEMFVSIVNLITD